MEQVWQPVCFPNVREAWVPVSALYINFVQWLMPVIITQELNAMLTT